MTAHCEAEREIGHDEWLYCNLGPGHEGDLHWDAFTNTTWKAGKP